MRHKVGDLVLDVGFRCMTVQNIKTSAVFQTDTQEWEKINI